MADSSWAEKMRSYEREIANIQVPAEPDKTDITRLESLIDTLYSKARFDLARAKTAFERTNRLWKDTKTESYLLATGTQKEREAMSIQFARKRKVGDSDLTIESALNIAEERYFYMEAVVDILRGKHNSLVIALGAAKLEKDLTR
ncbi:hypothetical protein [Desulfosporosinus youngiae]|uniref:Uncharacterized protein n=1 Tax=Desulfosporosinus youngiae DSM 17734 TaxID=768710 RepID=H5Y258_9FIRM|nr:hypothetical protein [Desulfosporosinus youngiae]EHQ88256.1 hypothetical protein DesyoDRAFT_1086 [Desulfosporosinus youngiae DSM 17734]